MKTVIALGLIFTTSFFWARAADAILLVGDWGNKGGGFQDVVLAYNEATGVYAGVFASGGGLDAPNDLKFGPDGNLYVASAGTDDILRFNGQTGAFMNVATGGGLDFPYGIAFGTDGNMYISNPAGIYADTVLRYSTATGAFLGVFISGLHGPRHLTFGPDGNLYVANDASNNVLRFNGATGAFIDVFASGSLSSPAGLAFGPDHNLYVSSYLSSQIFRFDGSSGAPLGILDTFGLSNPLGIAFGPDGNLYVANYHTVVTRYNGVTGAFIDVFASGGGLDSPHALVFTPEPSVLAVCCAGLFTHMCHRRSRRRP